MTSREVVAWIVVGILITFGGFMTYKTLSVGSDNKLLTQERDACRNSPVKTVIVIKHDTIHDTKWYTPKETVIHDTIHDSIPAKFCRHDYSDVYTFGKGDSTGSFTYNIHDRDCTPQINFSDFNYPIIHTTITKTIPKDTCIQIKQPIFRWGPYVGLTLNSFNKFPGIKIGAQTVIKDQVTVSGGMLIMNGVYGDVTFGWLFKK